MSTVKAAVFASGTGTNFRKIAEQSIKPNADYEIVLLVCDKPDAPVIQLAAEFAIPVLAFDPKAYPDKSSYEQEIGKQLKSLKTEWIFLAGYMRIVGPELLGMYPKRIINIHPSLLPDFPGKDAIGQAFHAQVKHTGVTVHYIDAGIDTGPIIAQEKLAILPDDTLETLEKRIHAVEHLLYPRTINQIIHQKRGV